MKYKEKLQDLFEFKSHKEIELVGFGSVTLIGVINPTYPLDYGNCMSMLDEEGNSYRVLNFVHENMEYLIDKEVLTFPVKSLLLDDGYVVIHDGRIGENWYRHEFCNTCCPIEMLPITQRLKTARNVLRGKTSFTYHDDGMVVKSIEVGNLE